jgi:type VI secretion system secreted protein VgrG
MSGTQAHRQIAIDTSLGEDVLLLKSVSAMEQFGRLFELELELQSENHAIHFDDIVGQNVTVRLELPNNGESMPP